MQSDNPLAPIRKQITELDQQLLQLLAQRRQLSLQVAQTKADAVSPVRDTERESALLNKLVQQGRLLGLDGQYVSRLFHTIIEDSVLRQQAWFAEQRNPNDAQAVSVAYLGAKGSYSHIAAYHYFERRDRTLIEMGKARFDQIFEAVEQGQADYGILPLENTSSGSINEVFDLLQHTNLHIVGETTETIAHCLLLADGADKAKVTTVFAHPQVHAQCSGYLLKKNWDQQYCASSAEAMSLAKQTPNSAAIGSKRGGSFYDLHVAEDNLANQQQNESRFIVVARKPISVPPQVPAKTTLLMATGQQSGALVDALLILKQNGLTMTKLESRPIHGNPWEEMFYLDIAANQESQPLQQALTQLVKITRFIKVLGCYPSDDILPTELESDALANDPRLSTSQPEQNENAPLHSRAARNQNSHIVAGSCQFDGTGLQILAFADGDQNLLASQVKEHGGHGIVSEQAASGSVLSVAQRVRSAKQVTNINANAAMLFVPAEQMNDSALLTQLGQQSRPVLLCRGYGATINQWLNAAETIMQQGNQQVVLVAASHDDKPDLHQLAELSNQTHLPLMLELNETDPVLQAQLAKAASAIGVAAILLKANEAYPVFMKQLFT